MQIYCIAKLSAIPITPVGKAKPLKDARSSGTGSLSVRLSFCWHVRGFNATEKGLPAIPAWRRLQNMDNRRVTTPLVCSHGYEHQHHSKTATTGARLFLYAQVVFIISAIALVVFFRKNPAFDTLSITFVSIFLEALPFMLLGSLIGGFIEVFISKDVLTKLLPGANWRTILVAAGSGLFFPVCECAIVPVVRRLFKKGLPLGAGVAFLLGGPIVNPLVLLSTAVAYGYQWSVAIERMLLGYLVAVSIGFLVELFFNRHTALAGESLEETHHCGCGHDHEEDTGDHKRRFSMKLVSACQHAAGDFLDICRYLVFGAFIAAVLQTVIARGEMAAVAGLPVLSILAMMFLAIILNLCSEADAFIAATFRTSLPISAQMAFMVLGPMLDIKLVLMYFRVFRKRFIIALSGMTFLIVFCSVLIKYWGNG